MRSLGRAGVPVYAITEDRWTPAAVSRYLVDHFTWPTTGAEPITELRSGLLGVAERIGRAAIAIPTDDKAATLLAEQFGPGDPLIIPKISPWLPRVLASKRRLTELCGQVGIPTPAAEYAASAADLLAYAEAGPFPVAVKKVDSWGTTQARAVENTTIIWSPEELVKLAMRSPAATDVMLQEYIPADAAEDWVFHMYCDAESNCRVAFTGIKLRSWPPRGGATATARIVSNETVAELSMRLCKEIGYRGIGDLDWRFDRRDGRYKLVDFNPRVGAQFRLFETDVGIDVVRALHLDLSGRPVPAGSQVEGRRFLAENLFALGMFAPRTRAALAPPLPPARGKVELAWLALDDPLPVLSMVVRFTAGMTRRVGLRALALLRPWGRHARARAASAALIRGAANAVPATNLSNGPKVAAAGKPVKNSPGIDDSEARVSTGQPTTLRS